MHQKNFDGWNVEKKAIHTSKFRGYIHEREIWWCSIGINIDDEEDGKNEKFERPVLVLKKFNNNIVLAVPLTTKIKGSKYYFGFEHDGVEFAAILSQLRLMSTKRFSRRIRKINSGLFSEIKKAVIKVSL